VGDTHVNKLCEKMECHNVKAGTKLSNLYS